MTRRYGLALIAMLALAGCQQEKSAAPAVAGGQILEGSVSDAMLPIDTVRSQAPLAPPTGAARSPAATEAAAEDQPAAEPTQSAPAAPEAASTAAP